MARSQPFRPPLLALPALFALACVAPEGAVTPGTHVLDMQALEAVTVETDALLVPADTDWLMGVLPGDRLISEAGLLREVVAIDSSTDPVRVSTVQGSLADVVEGLELEQESGNVVGKADVIGVDLGVHVLTEDEPLFSRGPLDVSIERASFDMWPVLDLDVEMHRFELEHLRFFVSTELASEVVLRAEIGASESFLEEQEVTLFESPPQFFVQWAGPVPIVESVTTRLVADLRIEGSVDEPLTAVIGAGAQAEMAAGFSYQDRDVAVLPPTVTLDTHTVGPDIDAGLVGHVAIGAALRPEVEVRFYEAAGVTLAVAAESSVRQELDSAECSMETTLRSDATVALHAFGVERSYERELVSRELPSRACN